MARKAGAARPARKRTNRRPWFESLESRCLLSADLVPVDLSQPPPELPAPQVISDTLTRNARELVVIDAGVADAGALVDIIRNRTDRAVEVVKLDADRDGLAQITALLDGHTGLDALHLISHGREGALQLGSGTLDLAALEAGADQLRAWQAALGADADILLYGCDLAGNAAGESFMQTLARLTGADVAASTDATGAAALGADWDLEARVGSVETVEIVDAEQAVRWQHQLALIAEDPFNGSGTLAGSFGGTGWTGTWAMFEGPSNRFRLQPPGLTPAGSMDTPSVSAVYTSSSTDSEVERSLASPIGQDGTTTWIGFLLQAGNTNANDYTGIVLGGELLGTTKVFAGYTRTGFYIEQQGGALATQVGGLIPVTGQTYRVVLRIQSTALGDTITMYVDPPTDDPDSATGTSATTTNLDPGAFARVALASGTGNSALDELRIGTTYADVVLGDAPYGTNSAPSLDDTQNPVLAAIDEDAGLPDGAVGTLVSELVDLDTASGGLDNVTDPDADAVTGIAITGADDANGSWHFSTDNGVTWTALETPAVTSARLLAADGNTRVYFQPLPNYFGTSAGALTFRAWDQTSGSNGATADTAANGGSTAFSEQLDTVALVVTAVNDAPVITDGYSHALPSTDENTTSSSTLVTDILTAAGWTDADGTAPRGLAVTSTTGNGAWSYSTDGITWNTFGSVSSTSALLLGAGTHVRYAPDGNNGEIATFGFRAWDQSSGTASSNTTRSRVNPGSGGGSSAFSAATASAAMTVTSVNDAPTLSTATTPLMTMNEDSGSPTGAVGNLVSSIADLNPPSGGVDNVTDPDAGAVSGMAILTTNESNGTWFYSTNGGASWQSVGAVSTTNALLLAGNANTRLYFRPNADYFDTAASGSSRLTFRAWDQTTGTSGTRVNASAAVSGGSTSLSAAVNDLFVKVNNINDAPVASGEATLAAVSQGDTNPSGALVSDLFAANFDNTLDGAGSTPLSAIAVIANTADPSHGRWQYSSNGTTWVNIPTSGLGDTSALVLPASSSNSYYLRFLPSGSFVGNPAALTVRLADGSGDESFSTSRNIALSTGEGSGIGGIGNYSAATVPLRTTVLANTAPVLGAPRTPLAISVTEDAVAPSGAVGRLVSTLVDFASPTGQVDNITDNDTGALLGVAITAADTSQGTWHFSTNNGGTWTTLSDPSAGPARLLAADTNTRLYFQPNANFNGSITNALTFRAWDRTSGSNGATADTSAAGGASAFSLSTNTVAVNVTAVNDAPVANGTATLGASARNDFNPPGNTVALLFADNYDDFADGTAPLAAVAIVGNASLSTQGNWQYSSDGTSWTDIPRRTLSDNAALVLPWTYRLRFRPATDYAGDPGALIARLSDGSAASGTGFAASRNITSEQGGSKPWSTATVDLGTSITAGASLNTAPVLDASRTPPAIAVAEDTGVPSGAVGTLVSTLVDFDSPAGQLDNVTDPDAGAQLGIAITSADTTRGTWYVSIDNGDNWTLLGNPSATAARLLAANGSTRVQFQPKAGFSGSVSGALTFRAWDRTTGSNGGTANTSSPGGTSAFSSATDTVDLNVTAVNDAPRVLPVAGGAAAYDFEAAGSGDRTVTSYIPGGAPMSLSGSATLAASAARPGSSGSTGLLMTAQVDSTTPQVTLGPLPGAATMTGFTFAGWVRFDGDGAQQSYERVFDFAQAQGSNFLALCRNGTSNNLRLHSYDEAGNTTGNVYVHNAIVTGRWMHLAATVTPGAGDTQTVVLYVNGAAAATYSLDAAEALDFSAWTRYRLGASNNGDDNRQFRGAMDDIHLFERGLTGAEVARLASTTPVTVATSEGAAPLVLDTLGSVVDPELAAAGSYAGATLTLSRNGGAHVSDVFSATGTLGALTQGGNLVVGGTTIGTVTTNSGGTLKLSFSAAATTALLDAAVRQIAYANASDAPPASVQINRVFSDGNTGAQGSGGALSVSTPVTVNIAAVNDAPVLDDSRTPPAIDAIKNAGLPAGAVGTLVSTLVDFASPAGQVDNVTDPDDGAQLGIAIVAADTTHGDWYFSTNNGGSWTALGTPGATTARLLGADGNTRLYFKPDAGYVGTVAEGLTFRAWDRTSGGNGDTANASTTGGMSPFSAQTDTVALTVAPGNGAPRALPVAGAAAAYDFEGVGTGESTIASHVPGGGEMTLGGSATVTTSAARPGAAAGSSGLLLTADVDSSSPQVTLAPLPGAASMTGFTFAGWVRFDTNGAGQSYERVADFASGVGYGWLALARYASSNDLILHSEDNSGADEGSGSVIVPDVIQPGQWMHVAATVDTLGSGDQSVTVYVNGVSGGSYTIAAASRLEFDNWTRYRLGASNNGDDNRQFRGAMDDIHLFERGLTGAEVARLASTTPVTVATSEGAAPLVLDTLGSVVDPELAAAAAGAGSYAGATLTLSRNGGAHASDVFSATGTLGALTQGGNLVVGGTTIGSVTTNSGGTLKLSFDAAATTALLDAAVRQIAYANTSDAPPASVQISRVLNDGNTGAQGAGGALSVNSPVIVNIIAVNDAPLADGEAALGDVERDETDPAGTTVSALFAGLYDDTADGVGATALSAVAIVQNSANAATQGRWQYSDGEDGAWQDVPTTVSDEAALVLPADYRLRFVPASGYAGTPGVLKVRLSDGTAAAGTGFDAARDITTATGGTGPWSNDAVPLGVTVVAINRAPTLGGANDLPDIDEDTTNNPGQTAAALLAGHAADADGDSVGIAVTWVDNSHGTWQYSTDGGTTWTAFGTPTPAAARLLGATARVRFVPAPDWNGEVVAGLSLRAWDGAIGVDGGTADASAGGGRRAFSEATAAIGVTVNAMAEASDGDLVLAAAAAGTAATPASSGNAGSGSASADASGSGSDAAGSGSRSQSESEASSSARTIMTMSVPRTPASGGRSARSTQGNSRSGDGSNDPDGTPIDPTQGGQTAVVVKDVQGNAGAGVGGNGAALPGFSAAGSTGGTGPALLTQSSGAATLPGSDLPAPTAEALAVARSALADTRWVAGLEKAEEAAREDAKVEQIVMGSGAAVAGSLTVGYASWLLRGGTLLSSLLVSMPAWRMFDPLPVLKRSGLEDGDGTDDPLERLFSRARSALAKPRPTAAGTATTPAAGDGSQYSQEVSS